MAGVMPTSFSSCCRHIAQPVAEHLGVGHVRSGLGYDAAGAIELADPVIQQTVFFRQGIALALLRDDVQELRAFQFADVAQRIQQHVQVVAVDGADVVEAEFLEHGARRDHAFDVLLGALGELQHGRHALQHLLAAAPHRGIETAGHQLRQIVVQRADRARDGHVVVVEDDQQVRIHRARVVQRLERHAAGHRAVADDGHRALVGAAQFGRDRHAQRRRDGGTGVAGAESVVWTFVALGEAGDAALHAQRAHRRAAPGQYLVHIGLVADIPHQLVLRRVEDGVQGDGQFHRAEIGRQMAAGLAHRFDQELAQLGRQLRQLFALQFAQVVRAVDGIEQSEHQNFLITMKSASSRRRCAAAPNSTSASSASACSSAAIFFAAGAPSSVT